LPAAASPKPVGNKKTMLAIGIAVGVVVLLAIVAVLTMSMA
jgi:hypothetical protein